MENTVELKSFRFAVRIVRLCKHLRESRKEFTLSRQLLRSGTSIGANIAEAQQAQSRPDFISKLNIALKEAVETNYWLRLLQATDYLSQASLTPSSQIVGSWRNCLHQLLKLPKSNR